MDRVSAEARSRNMARVRSRDTAPEVKIRSLLAFFFSLKIKFSYEISALDARTDDSCAERLL